MNNLEAWKWTTIIVNVVVCFTMWVLLPEALVEILLYLGIATPLWIIYLEINDFNKRLRKWIKF